MRTLALTFLLSAGTVHAQTSLGVPLVGQQTGSWCYAAATQMAGSLLGSSLVQCQISNQDNDRTDCCSSPTPAACINGGNTDAQLTYWGFPHSNIGDSISYAAVKNEIDAGRPVVNGWQWSGGGHHAIVVDGYWTKSDGSEWVEILNPLPVNHGDKEWSTYSAYLTSAYHPHTVSSTDYDIHWGPICDLDFNGLSSGDYQQCFDQRVHHGQWPSNLATGDGEMSGTFDGTSNRPVSWNASLSSLVSRNSALSSSGWRPKMVTVSDDVTFDAIWSSDEGKTWQSNFHLDGSDLHDTNATLAGEGFQMVDLFGYNDDVPRFSATWVEQAGGYRVDRAMTVAQFESEDATNSQAGFMLSRLSTYYDINGNLAVAALWLPSTVSNYKWVIGASDSTYPGYYNNWTSNGYSLAYTSKQGDTYNAIFTK